MKTLTHRERVLAALNLQEPDRVPLDLGGSASNMTDPVYFAVKKLLGFEKDIAPYRSGRTCNYYDERIFEALDIDLRWVSLKGPRDGRSLPRDPMGRTQMNGASDTATTAWKSPLSITPWHRPTWTIWSDTHGPIPGHQVGRMACWSGSGSCMTGPIMRLPHGRLPGSVCSRCAAS